MSIIVKLLCSSKPNFVMKYSLLIASVAFLLLSLSSCVQKDTPADETGLPENVLAMIHNLGFNPDDAFATDGGYIVEGDIFLTDEDLQMGNPFTSPMLLIAEEEQYHTFKLVTGLPRTIKVGTSGSISTNLSNGIDEAIDRYNAEGLELTFVRSNSNPDITIKVVSNVGYIASAGFPSNNGRPYRSISYNSAYQNFSLGFVATVVAHEMGHCIGFRHTDYMNRAYSCGSGGNEGQVTSGVGAVHIPGTPTGPDPNSWMLACLSSTTNRPFNNNDKTALNYLY